MAYLSDFKRSQIVGAPMARANVTKIRWIIWCNKEYITTIIY